MIDTLDDIPTMKATLNQDSWITILGVRLLGAMGGLWGITALFAAIIGVLGLWADGDGMALLGGLGTSAFLILVAGAAFALRVITLYGQQRMAGLV